MAVGAFAKAVASILNSTTVHNADTLLRLVRSRPPGVPLITVSNHMSTSVPFFPLLSSRFSFTVVCTPAFAFTALRCWIGLILAN